VYGSGKSSVAYLLEQQEKPFTLLDLDYLSWAGPDTGARAAEIELLSQNLAALVPNYRRISVAHKPESTPIILELDELVSEEGSTGPVRRQATLSAAGSRPGSRRPPRG
jgi:hypothetical protein